MKIGKLLLITPLILFTYLHSSAFCGFYVSKANANLFNKSSQVIIVRDGQNTVITMSNDFQGDVKDFAMVVPVPEVLAEENIRIADANIFARLDEYSGPRLVEYYDSDPCWNYGYYNDGMAMKSTLSVESVEIMDMAPVEDEEEYNVTIEAEYSVGEYDILILSAEESNGLYRWLNDNEYQIPDDAEEVLDPYIQDGLKFFVVKVNLEKKNKKDYEELSPIQIAFSSTKFGLPIRLGMANSMGDQDLIVYALTKSGQVECTNYRTVKIPTGNNIPEFVEVDFGEFYTGLFDMQYQNEKGKTVFMEYAWDLSSSNFVKCDPCPTTPPTYEELREAGVYWVGQQGGWGANYTGDVFITRLHVRYNRENFPQDLAFQVTPNKENFQGRYVMQKSLTYDPECEGAQDYFRMVFERRKDELDELAELTGWDVSQYAFYTEEYAEKLDDGGKGWIRPNFNNDSENLQKGSFMVDAWMWLKGWIRYIFGFTILLVSLPSLYRLIKRT